MKSQNILNLFNGYDFLKMSDRGINPFIRTLIYFFRSFKPSNFKKPNLVGSDPLGNRYFEIKADHSKGEKIRRYYEPRDQNNWDQELPSEWMEWLRMRRNDPPSFEESAQRLERLKKLQKNFDLKTEEFDSSPKNIGFPKYQEYEKIAGLENKKF